MDTKPIVLWCVVEDESTHDASINTVRSIWTDQALAEHEAMRLRKDKWHWTCDVCGMTSPQEIKQDGEACGQRHLGGRICDGKVHKDCSRESDITIEAVEANRAASVERQLA